MMSSASLNTAKVNQSRKQIIKVGVFYLEFLSTIKCKQLANKTYTSSVIFREIFTWDTISKLYTVLIYFRKEILSISVKTLMKIKL